MHKENNMLKSNMIMLLICMTPIFAQDFFEMSTEEETGKHSQAYELNGFIRGAVFGGKTIDGNDSELKSDYGELGLKMRARKGTWGDGYAEVRFRRGAEFNEPLSELTLREAYVDMYWGKLDVRMGQQIVVWGRADAFNPTNNVTPQNFLIRSSDEDDRKMGNFVIRSSYYLNPVRFELLWVPQYAPSVLPIPLQLFQLPLGVRFDEAINPDGQLKNSAVAAKLNLEMPAVGGSLSYFRGYMPMPGVTMKPLEISDQNAITIPIALKAYRMHVLGADFSTTIGSFGLRGEAAYRKSIDGYTVDKETVIDSTIHIPNPDLQYVLGVDRSIGDFSIILQYIGRYVFEFKAIDTENDLLGELELKNRMVSSQLYQMSHAAFMRPTMMFFHETLDIEFLAYYNVTTEEAILRPVIAYDLTDALTAKIGGEWYKGPENTLFGTIERALSSAFIELKASF
jgi:hypothetical protein